MFSNKHQPYISFPHCNPLFQFIFYQQAQLHWGQKQTLVVPLEAEGDGNSTNDGMGDGDSVCTGKQKSKSIGEIAAEVMQQRAKII